MILEPRRPLESVPLLSNPHSRRSIMSSNLKSGRQWWWIEVGPVFQGPGPGDGSDASLDKVQFYGTEADAKAQCQKMERRIAAKFRDPKRRPDEPECRDDEIGSFNVGGSIAP